MSSAPASPVPELAVLHFGDGEYIVLKPGACVRCAVSGALLPMAALRYWSSDRQEAYAGALEYLAAARSG